jgi:hypothetical protein
VRENRISAIYPQPIRKPGMKRIIGDPFRVSARIKNIGLKIALSDVEENLPQPANVSTTALAI